MVVEVRYEEIGIERGVDAPRVLVHEGMIWQLSDYDDSCACCTYENAVPEPDEVLTVSDDEEYELPFEDDYPEPYE
jgi:hypothetical protein